MMITYIKENLKHVLKQKKKDPQRKFRDTKINTKRIISYMGYSKQRIYHYIERSCMRGNYIKEPA